MQLPSLNNLFVRIAIGLALVAAAVALVAVPVVYVNGRIDSAYQKGYTVGKTECESEHVKKLEEDLERQKHFMNIEAEEAIAAEERATRSERNADKLSKKLQDALNQTPVIPSCIVNESATDVLRDFARGHFDTPDGTGISSPFDPEVSRNPLVPGSGGSNNS